ncbi:FimV/HubP family polar landmark protein, partial [Pseudoalteromonas sp. S554]|uniref:FimV/HubP family polar landmark protein n=1 Tax=Pseudoalteromonas sp. S554 TaxID=2066516 RepID=UPI0024B550B6
QELSQALSSNFDLDSLEDDFDNEPLIDNEFDESELVLEANDETEVSAPEATDESQILDENLEYSQNDLAETGTDLPNSEELESSDLGIEQTVDDELDELDELDAELEINDEVEGSIAQVNDDAVSAEELLPNRPSNGADFSGSGEDNSEITSDDAFTPELNDNEADNQNSAEDDIDSAGTNFNDDLLIDEFNELDGELDNLNDLNDDTLDDLLSESNNADGDYLAPDSSVGLDNPAFISESDDEINEQTNVDREAELTQVDSQGDTNLVSDEALDDEFMADLSETDFDSLLNELAAPDELAIEDSSEFDVDFDSLLKEDLVDEEVFNHKEPVPEDAKPLGEDDFVDIDSLLEQSDDAELEHEPYNDVNIDLGLSEFDALLAGDNPTDVDAESGGYSAKLDLARAYIEIDDFDSALKVIEDVIAKGPEEVQEEALSLQAKLQQ